MKKNIKFKLIYQSVAKDDWRKKLRAYDESVDIFKRRSDDKYWVYSDELIKTWPLGKKSKYENEPRPYIYYVYDYEIKELFPLADIDLLDSKSHSKEEVEEYRKSHK